MNLDLMNNKSKKYQMARHMNSQTRKHEDDEMAPIKNNHKNIHEKYMQRAKEIEIQEKKLKKELQSRIDDTELPHIYKKDKVGVQRVLYDPRYESGREYLKSSHKYGIESENTRKQ